MSTLRKKLIEVALPLEAINVASAREKSIRHGHPSTLHLWWAWRPLAACRAVLFGQLVDDPSAWPERFRDEAAQDRERQRLFRLIESLVVWENSNDEGVIHAARVEIAQSIARGRRADGVADSRDDDVLAEPPPLRRADGKWDKPQAARAKVIDSYLGDVAPPVHDPFAGGGSIPLEAQRLGLRAIATDLNPVAVLINKALIEIPPKFAGWAPVNPDSRMQRRQDWKGAQGLAEDVRYYGKWMRDEAFKKIGHLYPEADLPKEYGGGKATVIAWLWARTVASPDPAQGGAHVPLVSSFWLSKKPGKEAWVEPVVDRAQRTWRFEVRTGKPGDVAAVDAGTKTGRGDFACLLSGQPMPAAYIREQGQGGGLRDRLMTVVAEGKRGRVYLSPTDEQEAVARVQVPAGAPDTDLPVQALGFRVQNYGISRHVQLQTPRQAVFLDEFCRLAAGVPHRVWSDLVNSAASKEYANAIGLLAALSASKAARFSTTLSYWRPDEGKLSRAFGRQTVQMTWDFAETNPFSSTGGDLEGLANGTADVLISAVPQSSANGKAYQADAATYLSTGPLEVISSDPPYYDNIAYADLSDCFYVWLRIAAASILPELFSTVLTPKDAEIISEPNRRGGREAALRFFEDRIGVAVSRIVDAMAPAAPATLYYAYKQSEDDEVDGATVSASTGWETFLGALVASGLQTTGTIPIHTEGRTRMRAQASNALATSIVLVCRKRPPTAPTITRADFRRQLRAELPAALKALQHGNIAPVDMAQASIGPGMAIYSRCTRVLEADGAAMTVRTALQLINQALDEYLAEQEGEFDPDTRFALTWFETRAFDAGPYGEAETLAKARNVSVQGVAEAGILHAAAGKVRLYKRAELPANWDPAHDRRPTVWEAAQHLIKRLDEKGEAKAAELVAALGARAAPARDLAYRLYNVCERKGWAEEGRAYNGLVIAWPELEKLAANVAAETGGPAQRDLF